VQCVVDRCLFFLAFFFWPLCCLSFFNFRNLITHLVSLKNAQDRRGRNRVVISQCLSPLNLFECRSWRGVLDTTVYAKVCDKSVVFSVLSDFSSTIKTDRHDIIEILLKVGLNNINLTKPTQIYTCFLKIQLKNLF